MSAIKIWLLMNFLPETAGKIITVYMGELAQHAARLTWYGLAVVLALALWTMHLMDRSFNAIWRVSRGRSYWALLIGYTALLVLSLIHISEPTRLLSISY